MTGTTLAGGRLDDGRMVDITIADGLITAIAPAAAAPPGAILLAGRLVCAGFVDGHIHLDKTMLGLDWQPHRRGDTVARRIAEEKVALRGLALPTVERAAALVRQVVALGTSRLRCHVDIDPAVGLANLHAVLEVRARFADVIDIQIVAFPQSGILAAPGTADLLDAAVADGADLVGGLDPAGIDGDVTGHLDAVFAVASRRGVGVDIHLHDGDSLGAFELRQIARYAQTRGMQGRVAVSHAFALGMIGAHSFGPTADALAEGGVAIMTNGPGPAAMPPIKRLMEHGVIVFAGSDNIRDAWSPYGNGDMLERAMMIGYRAGFLADDDLRLAFDMASSIAAKVLGCPDHLLRVGAPADIVVLDAPHVPAAVAGRPGGRLVLKRGRVVAREGSFP
jgi:cytosine/creatinine deaminase